MDSYDICQRVKVKRYRPYGKLYTLLIPSGPWKEITINFITDLPPSKCKGSIYDSILVIVDRYTKIACYLLTIKKLNAVQLEELLIREIFLKFSILEGIVTNRRTLFTSAFWLEVCYQIQTKYRLSIAFYPQTDGQTECQNQILEYYLRTYCSDKQDNQAILLLIAKFTYRQSKYSTIGCSPFKVYYRYDPILELRYEDKATEGEVPAAKERIKEIDLIRQDLIKRQQGVLDSQAKFYN